MIVLIDNGHGSDTSGKCSPDKSMREYKWAREIAASIVNILKSKGIDARRIVTEETDIPLATRANRVNAICRQVGKQNVILISVHSNAAGDDGKWKSAGGWCVYTTPGRTKADDLATELWNAAQSELKPYAENFKVLQKAGEYDSRQVPLRADWSDGDPDYEANFYIIRKTLCPAVLTESLFQDNRADVEFLLSESGKNAIVSLHVNGIINYLNKSPNEKTSDFPHSAVDADLVPHQQAGSDITTRSCRSQQFRQRKG